MSTQTHPDDRTPSNATTIANLHRLTLPGPMLQRGDWLYVWWVQTPKGGRPYLGRTGDSSNPQATAPYTRIGQHLGSSKAQNSMRRLVTLAVLEPEPCGQRACADHGPGSSRMVP